MDRYNKYLVIKNSDIASFLNDYQKQTLEHLTNIIQNGRLSKGKAPQSYVCIAADWPMYEQVWSMVESFVDGKPNEIEQLTARVRELEEFKANVVKECASIIKHAHKDIAKQLAASQAYAEQLREALEFLSARIVTMDLGGVVERALALPHDISALDAFVEQKVKEIIESHAPDGRNVTNAQHVEMRHKFLEQIATLTRQRDLAVDALEWACGEKPNDEGKWFDAPDGAPKYWWRTELRKALSSIKESEGK